MKWSTLSAVLLLAVSACAESVPPQSASAPGAPPPGAGPPAAAPAAGGAGAMTPDAPAGGGAGAGGGGGTGAAGASAGGEGAAPAGTAPAGMGPGPAGAGAGGPGTEGGGAPGGAGDTGASAGGAGGTAETPGAAPGGAAPPGGGAPPPGGSPLTPDLTRLNVAGYVIPTFAATSRTQAVPRDRFIVGLVSSRAGLVFSGEPYAHWRFNVHVGFEAAILSNNISGARKVVTGTSGGINPQTGQPTGVEQFTFITDVPVEEATVSWVPIDAKLHPLGFNVTGGHLYIPFSVGAAATITAQMFPTRPGPATVFVAGADDGVVASVIGLSERIQARVGIFNGGSLGLKLPNSTTVGPTWSFFLDVHPLGKMPPREGDQSRGPPRIGLGVGGLYRLGTLYDAAGYQATKFRDMRLSAAARLAAYGLFLQFEYLRRLQTDDLSSRPATATGFYGQGSFYIPLPKSSVALGPLARGGLATTDQDFYPQKTISFEAGVAFYPRADLPEPDALRIILEYVREQRQPFEETSNGGVANMQLRF